MSEEARHIIRKHRFEVDFESEVQPNTARELLRDFHERILRPELERLFNALAPGEAVIRIDKLELDLGSIRMDAPEEQLRSLAAEAIHRCLSKLNIPVPGEPVPDSTDTPLRRMSREESQLEQLEQYLLTGRRKRGRAQGDPGLEEMLRALLKAAPEDTVRMLARLVHSRSALRRLAQMRDEHLKDQLIYLLRPAKAGVLRAVKRDLKAISVLARPKNISFREALIQLDESLIRLLLQTQLLPEAELALLYLRGLAVRTPDPARQIGLFHRAVEQLREEGRLEKPARMIDVLERLEKLRKEGLSPRRKPEASPERERDESPGIPWRNEPELQEEIFLDNAGLILLWPFLPHLFHYFGWLNEDGKLGGDEAMSKAAVLLDRIAGRTESQEENMVLNKILCGLDSEDVIDTLAELLPEELDEADNLIRTVIERWSAIGNMSVEGFRGSFLFREGRLSRKFGQEGWTLRVDSKPYDALLDRLPYSLSTVKTKLMNEPVYVEW